jgi:hypothetical protein
MNRSALLLAAVLAASLSYAAEPHAKKPATLQHEVAAEVVSVNAASHTITLKTDKGESTMPVEGKAIGSLKNIKAGEKVTVTCKDIGGEHKSVTAIKVNTKTAKS